MLYVGAQSRENEVGTLFSCISFFSDVYFNIILVNFKIGLFFNFKGKLPLAMQSFLVNKYSCASEYVSSTIRTLHTRVAEHAGRSFRTGSLLTVPSHSNIRQHASSCGVPVSMNNFKVMGNTKFFNNLHILDSLFMHKLKPKLNDAQSSFPFLIVNH